MGADEEKDSEGSKASGKKGGRKKQNMSQWKRSSKTFGFWVILILLSIASVRIFEKVNGQKRIISFYDFEQFLDENSTHKIVKASIVMSENGTEFHGTLDHPAAYQSKQGNRKIEYLQFIVYLPFVDSSMLEKWRTRGIDYNFKTKGVNWFGFFVSILPWLLMFGFWIFLFRQMQGGGQKGIFSFGKSRAKMFTKDRPKVTFDNVAGCDEAKVELEEIIEFLKEPKKFQRLGGKIPKGALLVGPPGCGKTLLAKAIAGEAGVPFFSMSGSDFVEMFVGVGASRVRDLFEQGKKNAPCIIFIDEIDAVGRHRGAGLGGGHDEREQTLNQLLVEMDGFETNKGVIIIAATNRPDVLDPALLRPGRFDRTVVVDNPDINGREGILKVHIKNIPLSQDVNLRDIARGTPGFSGADIANLVNEAALLAARLNQTSVSNIDFEEAKDKILMGVERKSRIISEEEKKITAYHEAGHALLVTLLPNAEPLHKVTIIPRGMALGVTFSLPEKDVYIRTKEYFLDSICVMFGGRLTEEMIFAKISSGAQNDIHQATDMARKMVCDFGMSDTLGPIAYGKKEQQIFLGREIAQHRDYSEKTAEAIDLEVNHIIHAQIDRAKKYLVDNKEKVVLLAEALLEHETLDREEINLILSGNKIVTAKKNRIVQKSKEQTGQPSLVNVPSSSEESIANGSFSQNPGPPDHQIDKLA